MNLMIRSLGPFICYEKKNSLANNHITSFLCPGERVRLTGLFSLSLPVCFRSIILSSKNLIKPCRPTYITLDNYKCIISGFLNLLMGL